jgi:hypothetical protein
VKHRLSDKDGKNHLREAIITGFVFAVILTWVGINSPAFWLNAFLVVLAWSIASWVARRFVAEEGGVTAYVLYFVGILIASAVSEIFSKAVLEAITIMSFSATDPKTYYYFSGSLAMCIAVYYAVQFEVAKKPEETGRQSKQATEGHT